MTSLTEHDLFPASSIANVDCGIREENQTAFLARLIRHARFLRVGKTKDGTLEPQGHIHEQQAASSFFRERLRG